MANPYEALPDQAFWRTAISGRSPFDVSDLWSPRWPISASTRIATFGSCFAQHFGNALRARNYCWVDAEQPPATFPSHLRATFGYGMFSARTGNIYTTRQLRQWVEWSLRPAAMPTEYWDYAGRIYDPFRPSIEPNGFASAEEMMALRATTLHSIAAILRTADVLVFTLGLTEGWVNGEHGYHYQSCPGTVAGRFSPGLHHFHNASFAEMVDDLVATRDLIATVNPAIKILLTVSPVPLTATASGRHVLAATTHSKSLLRAVAAQFAASNGAVDYFPSYEMITGAPFRSMFFEPNLRNVNPVGVDFVMRNFFAALDPEQHDLQRDVPEGASIVADALCDDAKLEMYGATR
ncbi:GSCFA domain-containing protein [Sphingomonas sp. 10B4]|uniref:GSCFA domain-containing protein n=1 Tax=Sphingomonas sp. 10B4 TaxID=3048575 RepID=UPI002AB59FD1|nr:GSCFA domain-containing protein [Sphingomonas sp. 10B4]MDY7522582.1 GSCFA domain-containing protein [Sphingomonas sp. 10B4]MEB0283977.1 GSCFA domain-containing protein [Sphingomonas sp. 10B4]